jgi:hypothetical protein
MTIATQSTSKQVIDYPDCDGQPIGEDTLHFEWIIRIEQWLEVHYFHDPNVFVAGDLLWYPVEGEPTIRTAPDALVAFGIPKGHRGSYKQWMEGNIVPQVPEIAGFVSPRLQIRFEPGEESAELKFFRPDGTRFLTFFEALDERDAAKMRLQRALAAEELAQRERGDRYAAKLRELGFDPDSA